MTQVLSENTQAILLLTAPLIAGRATASPELLSPREYNRLARHLREEKLQPANLISPDAEQLLRACHHVVEESRLRRLLGRGFLLSQVIERWQARAIWVMSRGDIEYPRRLKQRLREDAPAVLYGCGDVNLLETGGLAVVGSRYVDDELIEYSMAVGRLAAGAHRTTISGGAKGVDQGAMRGALEAGGRAVGILSDSLEKTAMNHQHRSMIVDAKLVFISPYDPGAGFHVGNAMQRNKLVYALADAALVVNADLNKGGTWAGANEQLEKLRLVPVYVRSTGVISEGLTALRRKGAIPWPNPKNAQAFEEVFNVAVSANAGAKEDGPELFAKDGQPGSASSTQEPPMPYAQSASDRETKTAFPRMTLREGQHLSQAADIGPAEVLFATVRKEITRLLKVPMKGADVAAALNVSTAQGRAWLERLVTEGLLEKQKKPACYRVKESRLFE